MMEYILMGPEHTSAVAAMEKECFCTPWSENAICAELNNPLSLWLVAVDNGKVVGYVGSQSVPPESDMMNLAVTDRWRRRGIAAELVKNLVDKLKTSGITSITLEVRQSNLPAIALYEKLGFSQVGLRPNYYSKPKEAALILRKEWEV